MPDLDLLAKIARSDASGGRALSAKLRALMTLVDAGKASPVPRSELRVQLQSIAATEQLSGRALESAVRAITALEELGRKPRRRTRAKKAPEDPFFDLSLTFNMCMALGWRVSQQEWREGSPRTRRLAREAGKILADRDPEAAFAAWRESVGARAWR